MGAYLTERDVVCGLLAPVDKTGASYSGTGVSMANHKRCTFLVTWGVMSTTDSLTILVKANSAATAGGTAIACRYKAVTTGSATASFLDPSSYSTLAAGGLTWDNTNGNKILAIEVLDSDLGTNGRYVNLSWGSPGAHACLVSVIAILSDGRQQAVAPAVNPNT